VGYITLARSKSKSLYALAMTLPEASDFLGGRCATVAGLGQLTLLVGLPPDEALEEGHLVDLTAPMAVDLVPAARTSPGALHAMHAGQP
jgi:hypothetical protein